MSDRDPTPPRQHPDWLTWLIVVIVTIIGMTILGLWAWAMAR